MNFRKKILASLLFALLPYCPALGWNFEDVVPSCMKKIGLNIIWDGLNEIIWLPDNQETYQRLQQEQLVLKLKLDYSNCILDDHHDRVCDELLTAIKSLQPTAQATKTPS